MAAPNSPSTMHLNAPVHVEPHPAELPLMLLVAAVSLGIWAMLVVTIIGSPVVLYWLIKKGTEGPNRFGEDRLAALSASKTPDIVT